VYNGQKVSKRILENGKELIFTEEIFKQNTELMFQKGQSGNPNGRAKGSKNHATKEIKERYTQLIQGNLDSIQGWLNKTAAVDPAKALDFLIKLSPFVIPKQVQQDISFDSPINIIIPKNPNEQEASDDVTED
jgi:hypothetical protein